MTESGSSHVNQENAHRPDGRLFRDDALRRIALLDLEARFVPRRSAALVIAEIGGNPDLRYILLSHKKSKGWFECVGGELEPPDIERMQEEVIPSINLFIEQYCQNVADIRNGRTGRLRRTDVYAIMEHEADLQRQIDSIVLAEQREWALENLLREVAEETGISSIPDSIIDLSSHFLHFIPGYSPQLEDRIIGGKLQLPFAFKYRMNSLPKIGDQEEHDASVWIRWPPVGTKGSKEPSEIQFVIDSIVRGELATTLERKRADKLRFVLSTEGAEDIDIRKIGPLSEVTQSILIHCLTAEATGRLR